MVIKNKNLNNLCNRPGCIEDYCAELHRETGSYPESILCNSAVLSASSRNNYSLLNDLTGFILETFSEWYDTHKNAINNTVSAVPMKINTLIGAW
jgi:hypothetical protein